MKSMYVEILFVYLRRFINRIFFRIFLTLHAFQLISTVTSLCDYVEFDWKERSPSYTCKVTELSGKEGNHAPGRSDSDVLGYVEIFSTNAVDFNQIGKRFPNLEAVLIRMTNLNSLSQKAFKNIRNLRRLNLNDNKIRFIQCGVFAVLTDLKELNVAKNEIEDLFINTFHTLRKLQYLNLSKNQLTCLVEGLFSFNEELRELLLEGNSLTYISPNSFDDLKQIEIIDIHNNNCVDLAAYTSPSSLLISSLKESLENCTVLFCNMEISLHILIGTIKDHNSGKSDESYEFFDHWIFEAFFGKW